jgi:hypothetical protein
MLAAKARKVNGIPVLKMKPKGRVPKMAQPRGMPISVGKKQTVTPNLCCLLERHWRIVITITSRGPTLY